MKFELEFRETRAVFFTVEADSLDEAKQLVEENAVDSDKDEFEELEFTG